MPHAHPVGPFPEGVDPEDYDRRRRRVLWSLPGGLFLLGSVAGEERNLMTCNLVAQLATEPKLVGVSVEVDARTCRLVSEGRAFALALLDPGDRALVRRFVKPAVHDRAGRTLNGVPYRDAPATGAPVPGTAVAFLDCRVVQEVPLGSHTLFVGEVVHSAGPEGAGHLPVLRMEDTKMSYGG